VLAYRTREEALSAIREVGSRYAHHCAAAREIAASYFDARSVLTSLVERAVSAPSVREAGET
jgi:hypothetical protein